MLLPVIILILLVFAPSAGRPSLLPAFPPRPAADGPPAQHEGQ